MNIEFKDIKDNNFFKLVEKAKLLFPYAVLNKYKRRELINFAYNLNPVLSNEQIKFLYALENPENINIIHSVNFNINNFTMKFPTTFLKKTDKGTIITIDERPIYKGGGLGKFVCDHTARVTNSFVQSKITDNLDITGFIHVPESPDYIQFVEVLSLVVKAVSKYKNNNTNLKIMFTGFTKFRRVENNATSDFLFGDGVSNDFSSFCFKDQTPEAEMRLDKIIYEASGEYIKSEKILFEDKVCGKKYSFSNDKTLEIFLVRLPVDTEIVRKNYSETEINYNDFLLKLSNNDYGDRVQFILNYVVKSLKPDAIISLGVHSQLPSDIYEIETEIYGLDPKYSKSVRPRYVNHLGKGLNKTLENLYKLVLN